MDDARIAELLRGVQVIAVVGLSPNPERPSNQVAWYLRHVGYRLYGVNPLVEGPISGVPVVGELALVPERVDLVDVFRRPEHAPDLARAAAAVGARTLWLQLGIRSAQAEAVAARAGLAYVEDRCLKVEHARLVARAG
ncbi:MAG TPA: CoA-binding protein [Actinomycetes bacterium]|nr:CoA-binding protein [Actinomycetes bacterium]